MPPADSAMETASVDQVTAMSDADLAQFMQRHRHRNGDYDLPIHGWDKLSKDERGRLAQSLEAQQRDLAQSPSACSRPIDLDDLDARLRQVSPIKSFSLRPEAEITPQSITPTEPYDPTEAEAEIYHELISDGGRPLYPIDLIQEIRNQPEKYAELLSPWQETSTALPGWSILKTQWQRWQDFRKWQNDNRDREDENDGFDAYVERRKSNLQRRYRAKHRDEQLAKLEADPSCLEADYDIEDALRDRQRRLYRERGCRGFHEYAEAVKRRLARHDFTQPFALDEDPKKQDKLTTWIEYLNYEYWWLDKHTGDIDLLGPKHDRLWQDLVDEGIPRRHEKKELVRTDSSVMSRQREHDMASLAVRRAESEGKRVYALTQEDPNRFKIPREKRISMLKVASANVDSSRRRFQRVKEHNNRILDFIQATWDFEDAQRFAHRHESLVQWVLGQVPLVEAEMSPSEAGRHRAGAKKGIKRRLASDDAPLGAPSPKRVRFNLRQRSRTNSRASSKVLPSQPAFSGTAKLEATHDTKPQNLAAGTLQLGLATQTVSTGLRRSARIAARRAASRGEVEPDTSRQRLSSNGKRTQPARHGSGLEKATARLVTGESRRISQRGIAKTERRPQRGAQRLSGRRTDPG